MLIRCELELVVYLVGGGAAGVLVLLDFLDGEVFV